mmetsp:Transcript_2828/g.5066  ORF Transcript_2828/g.5066 Transcript_2828/m.5066 type:complete len:101 (-) Transcript_2828:1275-1577(-)
MPVSSGPDGKDMVKLDDDGLRSAPIALAGAPPAGVCERKGEAPRLMPSIDAWGSTRWQGDKGLGGDGAWTVARLGDGMEDEGAPHGEGPSRALLVGWDKP